MISFTCKTKQLIKVTNRLKALNKGKHISFFSFSCEITLTDGQIRFSVPGATFGLDCETIGTAKATLPFKTILSILQYHNNESITVEFYDGSLRFGLVQVQAQTCFFENDKILRTIHLPHNYTKLDLLQLLQQNYTLEELMFNNLFDAIMSAQRSVYYDIRRATSYLKNYGISPKEVKKMVMDRLNVNLNLEEKSPEYLYSTVMQENLD